MAHWGGAYAVGPNYNFPWELEDPAGKAAALARAYDSARAALALVGRLREAGDRFLMTVAKAPVEAAVGRPPLRSTDAGSGGLRATSPKMDEEGTWTTLTISGPYTRKVSTNSREPHTC
jgi:hypothetical protein